MKKFIIFLFFLCLIIGGALVGSYFYLIKGGKDNETVNIYVNEGVTYSTISKMLKDNELIKSELAYKIYIKLNPPKDLEFGDYILKTNYDLEELITTLEKGSVSLAATKRVTFTEGKNMRYVIKTITDNFEISEEDFRLRGSGDFFGNRQSGDMNFKLADVCHDFKILRQAKEDAELLVQGKLNLTKEEELYFKNFQKSMSHLD